MSHIPTAEVRSKYTEEERTHWRFADQGIRWTTLGISLMAAAMLLTILTISSVLAVAKPRNIGAGRGVVGITEPLYQLGWFLALSCTLLGLLAMMIGLTLCAFTPRPLLAKFLALGSVVFLIWSYISIGRSLTLQLSFGASNPRYPGMSGGIYELSSLYMTAIAEYFLSIILGCCYLLAIASEFHQRELIRNVHNYLKMLFGVLVIIFALGLVFSLVANSVAAAVTWGPIAGIVLLAVVYCWMAYSLLKLLNEAHRMILNEIDPQYQPPNRPVTKPVVIDPLAD